MLGRSAAKGLIPTQSGRCSGMIRRTAIDPARMLEADVFWECCPSRYTGDVYNLRRGITKRGKYGGDGGISGRYFAVWDAFVCHLALVCTTAVDIKPRCFPR